MSQDEDGSDTRRILDTVTALIEAEGCKKVVLRDVADQARMSLATIYKAFPSRDELIVAAVERWMDENIFDPLKKPIPEGTLYEKLMWVYHHLFEPWEEHPRMLDAFVRASTGVGGDRLRPDRAIDWTDISKAILGNLDQAFAQDVETILSAVTAGAAVSYVSGRIGITEILPIIERTVYRLTENRDASVMRTVGAAGAF